MPGPAPDPRDPSGADVAALRARLSVHPLRAARQVLGSTLVVDGAGGPVRARIVEVEAYGSPADGPWPDPAAHSYPGVTGRNAVMFGPAGHLYVYLSYGIHLCVNVTAGPDGDGAGVLLRAAEITAGEAVVRSRRGVAGVRDAAARLAAGPGRLGQALGITLADKGLDLLDPGSPIRLELASHRPTVSKRPSPAESNRPGPTVAAGPRIGIAKAVDLPWRLWLAGNPAVSR